MTTGERELISDEIRSEQSYNYISSGSEIVEENPEDLKNLPEVNPEELIKKLHSLPRSQKSQNPNNPSNNPPNTLQTAGNRNLQLNEKLYIISETRKTSIIAAAKEFNLSPSTIWEWLRMLQKCGVSGIAPRPRKGAISEQKQRHIHKRLLAGMNRQDVIKYYHINKSFINKIVTKYGKVIGGRRDNGIVRREIEEIKEIVRYGEEFGRKAALNKYRVGGVQFSHYYRQYGKKLGGKDIEEILNYLRENGCEAAVDKYCMGRTKLLYYCRKYGYKFRNGTWEKIRKCNKHKKNKNKINKRKKINKKRSKPEPVEIQSSVGNSKINSNPYESKTSSFSSSPPFPAHICTDSDKFLIGNVNNENHIQKNFNNNIYGDDSSNYKDNNGILPNPFDNSDSKLSTKINNSSKRSNISSDSNILEKHSRKHRYNKNQRKLNTREITQIQENLTQNAKMAEMREIVLFSEHNGQRKAMRKYSISSNTLDKYCKHIYWENIRGGINVCHGVNDDLGTTEDGMLELSASFSVNISDS